MSTPITFSGFNDIDFNVVLNALMTQASAPLTALQTQQSALKSRMTSFDSLRARIDTLKTAADGLSSLSGVSATAGTSTNSAAVSVSSGPGATPAHYDVVVSSLARAQVTASAETFADADTTIVASGGSLTIGSAVVTIAGDTTLQGLVDTINATPDTGVTAAVVQTGPGAYRLALTSTLTGTANAFTVTNGLTGGAGLTFGANVVNASDAAITINNIPATSSSNSFNGIVPGVTVTVHQVSASPVGIDIAQDSGAFADRIERFIAGYNDMVGFLEAQRVSAGAGDTKSIGNDPLLRQLRGNLRSSLLGAHGSGDNAYSHLSEIGIEFMRDGTLKLDRTRFDAALSANGDDVRALFAGDGGAFPAVQTMLAEYTTSTGFISSAKDRLNKQVSLMDSQILAMQSRLAIQRDALQRQFTEADAAMSRLKNQSGSLASLGI